MDPFRKNQVRANRFGRKDVKAQMRSSMQNALIVFSFNEMDLPGTNLGHEAAQKVTRAIGEQINRQTFLFCGRVLNAARSSAVFDATSVFRSH
jgi:hypothetical protein